MPLKLFLTSAIITLAMGCSTLGKTHPSNILTNDAVNMINDDLADPAHKNLFPHA
jgi:hypothetical protein